jgi:predicted DCC family thiol-disulfide oxidoreductase YuxK
MRPYGSFAFCVFQVINLPMNTSTLRSPLGGPIIVFDAMCVLCSANAQFVLAHDKLGRFRLASMQGDVGGALFSRFGIDPADPDTIIVVDGDKVWQNSDAVLAIYDGLGWPWRLAAIFKLVPRFIRDPIYRLIASNRYRIFGKRETCWLPTAEQAKRVL